MGVWSITLEPLSALRSIMNLRRVVYNKDTLDSSTFQTFLDLGDGDGGVQFVPLIEKAYLNCLKNVPGHSTSESSRFAVASIADDTDNNDDNNINKNVICVVRNVSSHPSAPIAVMVQLEKPGNLGTIYRSIVQSNLFEGVIIVDGGVGGSRQGEKTTTTNNNSNNNNVKKNPQRISEKDINYYSMCNAPLIGIMKRFDDCNAFYNFATKLSKRKVVATALVPNSLSAYSESGIDLITDPKVFIMMGSEEHGLPKQVLERGDTTFIHIPTLASSLNVGCAMSMIISIITIEQHRRQRALEVV